MSGRLAGKVALVVGAGQQPGDTIGNGRAIALTFAREGAEVLCVDRIAERAEETAAMIDDAGGMGTAWDTANAALFLASDEARFITGVLLPVDGGASVRVG